MRCYHGAKGTENTRQTWVGLRAMAGLYSVPQDLFLNPRKETLWMCISLYSMSTGSPYLKRETEQVHLRKNYQFIPISKKSAFFVSLSQRSGKSVQALIRIQHISKNTHLCSHGISQSRSVR